MNFRKFIHDIKYNTNHYTVMEAADYLEIGIERVRHLVRIGALIPAEGGGRGKDFYFTEESLEEIDKKLEPYR